MKFVPIFNWFCGLKRAASVISACYRFLICNAPDNYEHWQRENKIK